MSDQKKKIRLNDSLLSKINTESCKTKQKKGKPIVNTDDFDKLLSDMPLVDVFNIAFIFAFEKKLNDDDFSFSYLLKIAMDKSNIFKEEGDIFECIIVLMHFLRQEMKSKKTVNTYSFINKIVCKVFIDKLEELLDEKASD